MKSAMTPFPFTTPALIMLMSGVLLGACTACAPATRYARMIDHVHDSIVRVTDTEAIVCTGEVIAAERILTAAHCLENDGPFYTDGVLAKVLKVDEQADLALLSAPVHRPALVLRVETVPRFETFTGVGYAFGTRRLYDLRVQSLLIDVAPDGVRTPGLIMQTGYIPGMSGGPVIDDRGQMVGIIQQTNAGVGYGVGTLIIRAFLLGVDPD